MGSNLSKRIQSCSQEEVLEQAVEEGLQYTHTFSKGQYVMVISSPFLIFLMAYRYFWPPSLHGNIMEVEKSALGSQLWLMKE